MGKLPTLPPRREEMARLRRNTIIMSDELSSVIRRTRTDKWIEMGPLQFSVRSDNPLHNMDEEDERRHATIVEINNARASKIGGTTGCTKVRIEEHGSSRVVVLMKPIGSEYWKVYSDITAPSGQRAGTRLRGHGPAVEFAS